MYRRIPADLRQSFRRNPTFEDRARAMLPCAGRSCRASPCRCRRRALTAGRRRFLGNIFGMSRDRIGEFLRIYADRTGENLHSRGERWLCSRARAAPIGLLRASAVGGLTEGFLDFTRLYRRIPADLRQLCRRKPTFEGRALVSLPCASLPSGFPAPLPSATPTAGRRKDFGISHEPIGEFLRIYADRIGENLHS